MEPWPQHVTGARAERRAMIALVAVFALLVQALIPSLAGAATGPGDGLAICTSLGLQSAPADSSGPIAPVPGHDCQHCVCPALSAEPPPVISVLPVAYVAAEAPVAPTPPGVRPLARAPPRPPGQGPPAPNA